MDQRGTECELATYDAVRSVVCLAAGLLGPGLASIGLLVAMQDT